MGTDSRSHAAALEALSSLITKRKRVKTANFDASLMNTYLQILGLEEAVNQLSIIHVAGTKGKGSTCAFTESILRECGYRTGLFTSPHLIDVRERFRFNGVEVSENMFLHYFWWCWDRLEASCNDTIPRPPYFRFLTLLAFKMFTTEKVDVAILEVGLGGKFDPTNVVKAPDVCGVTSLGFDHMEILGYTLREIAGEKAGIFKEGVPAFTVMQPHEALMALRKRANELDIPLKIATPIDRNLKLGLSGDHQYINAGLAVELCNSWAKRRGKQQHVHMVESATERGCLPEPYIKGLLNIQLLGRAQIVNDILPSSLNCPRGDLTFFLDGAHSPESMEVAAKWFCSAVLADVLNGADSRDSDKGRTNLMRQVLLFNCMPERDPNLLFPPLLDICLEHGIYFEKAIFVPEFSSYTSRSSKTNSDVDLSWQSSLQKCWDNFIQQKLLGVQTDANKLIKDEGCEINLSVSYQEKENAGLPRKTSIAVTSLVMPDLPTALDSLRKCAQKHPCLHYQVFVTGSLHLVGDLLKLLKR